jgi:hypothetical protein
MITNFYYSAILFNEIILVDHSEYEYNFKRELKLISKNLIDKGGVIKKEHLNYIYIKENNFIFFSIIDSSIPEKTSLAFLYSIQEEFNNKINKEQQSQIDFSVSEYCLKDFESILEEKMKFYEENVGTSSSENVTNLKNNIITMHKEVLKANEKLIERNETMFNINDKAKNLSEFSDFYLKSAKKVTCAAKCKRYKICIFSIIGILVFIYFITGMKCGFDLHKCI